MNEHDLVRRALDGDSAAFAALVDQHAPACLRFATRMLGNRDDAEDATQEAIVRAYRALAVYDGRATFRAWLFAILVNRCRSMLTTRARRERWFRTDEAAVASATVSADLNAELRIELTRALATLPAEQREAFLLKHVEQLEYTEIAAVTGVGVSALKMRVQRACTRLKEVLQEYDHAR